jgi:hypothetical protein
VSHSLFALKAFHYPCECQGYHLFPFQVSYLRYTSVMTSYFYKYKTKKKCCSQYISRTMNIKLIVKDFCSCSNMSACKSLQTSTSWSREEPVLQCSCVTNSNKIVGFLALLQWEKIEYQACQHTADFPGSSK